MENFEAFKEKILREYPRLSPESTFRFACHKEVPCFGKCCADVNIFLTPYDVLRMKRALGILSGEFLDRYTSTLVMGENQIPLVMLKMHEEGDRKCPFVSEEGCTIYADRPWACRMYPLGLASSRGSSGSGEEFCFIVGEDSLCQGFKEDKEWTVAAWLEDQDVRTYDAKSESYMRFTLHPHFVEKKALDGPKVQMLYKALYDLDGFREMIFGSTFLDRFEVRQDLREALKTDDEDLLEFAIKFLRFALFHENTLVIRDEELERQARAMGYRVE